MSFQALAPRGSKVMRDQRRRVWLRMRFILCIGMRNWMRQGMDDALTGTASSL